MSDALASTRFSLKKRLVANGAWVVGGKAVTVIATLLVNALLARLLSPEKYGAYFLIFSAVNILSLVGQLGLNRAIVRLIAEAEAVNASGRTMRVLGMTNKMVLGASLIVATLYFLGGGKWLAVTVVHSPPMAEVVGVSAVLIIPVAMLSLFAEEFRGFHDIRLAAVFSGLATCVLTLTGLSFLWWFKGTAALGTCLGVSLIASSLAAAIAGTLLLRKRSALASSRSFSKRELLGIALPFLTTSLSFVGLRELHLWILGAFCSDFEVALYGASNRLINLITMPLFVANAVLPPTVAQLYAQNRHEELQKTLQLSAALVVVPAIAGSMALLFFGRNILSLLYGEYYISGYVVLTILIPAQLLNVLTGSPCLLLMMSGRERIMMIISISSGLAGLTTSFIATPLWGMKGAAFGTGIALCLQNLIACLYCKAKLGVATYPNAGSFKFFYGRLKGALIK